MTTEQHEILQVQSDDPEMQRMAQEFVNHVDVSPAVTEQIPGGISVQQIPSRNMSIWHVPTGEERVIPIDLVNDALAEVGAQGQPVFSLTPVVLANVGNVKCRLHEDDPDRELWDSMGLRSCTKDDLDNVFQRRNHLRRVHKLENEAIEAYEQETNERKWQAEQQESRQFNQQLLSSMRDIAASRPIAQTVPAHTHSYGKGTSCTVEGCGHEKPSPETE